MSTTTLVRRRLDAARTLDARLYAQRDAAIERLAKIDGRLKQNRRAIARLDKSLKAKTAAELAALSAPEPLPADTVADLAAAIGHAPINPVLGEEKDGIPAKLDRRNLMADPKTKEKKAERRMIEKEKLDAKLTGKLKAMPLTGRAALDAIRNG